MGRLIELLDARTDLAGAASSIGGLAGGPGVQASVRAENAAGAARRAEASFLEVLLEAGFGGVPVARVDVMTEDYLDQWVSQPAPQYVGLAEIAKILQVSKQRVYQLREREGFPRPVVELAAGPVWIRESLDHFIAGWERTPGRPKLSAVETTHSMGGGPRIVPNSKTAAFTTGGDKAGRALSQRKATKPSPTSEKGTRATADRES